MSPHCTSDEDRLTRLEELTFFQEERLKELDAAVTAMGGSADLGHMYENAQEFVRIAVIS